MGGDLPASDAFTYELLTNAEVQAVNQHSENGRESYRDGTVVAWTADEPGSGAKYVAVFERGDKEVTVDLPWSKVGVDWSSPAVRDVWQHKDQKGVAAMHITLRPHASVLYKVSR